MIDYKMTPTELSIHRADKNPIYSDGGTHVRLCDEGGGYFIELTQSDYVGTGLKFDLGEIPVIFKAIDKLIKASTKCN